MNELIPLQRVVQRTYSMVSGGRRVTYTTGLVTSECTRGVIDPVYSVYSRHVAGGEIPPGNSEFPPEIF